MLYDQPSPDFPDYNEKTADVWDRLAEWWDDEIGDGNAVQDLLEPITERMLELKPGGRLLDIACGAGRFARRMAAAGANVVAIDHSERFIHRALQRSEGLDHKIEYRVVNAVDTAALLSLGEARFDAAVSTMALMDMASIEPLISTLPRLLGADGKFVFSVNHPAFNSGTVRRIAEEQDINGRLVTTFGAVVTNYSTGYVHMGTGVPGQPEPQFYFHRPIGMLLNTCFKNGFVLDWIEEPTLPDSAVSKSQRPLSWSNFHEIPHSMVVRMRLAGPAMA